MSSRSESGAPERGGADLPQPDEEGSVTAGSGATASDDDFERLLTFLKDSRAFDFTGYKRPSLLRRIRHRMREVSITSVDDYIDLLQLQPEEFTALFNTILINVTGFFRDSEAWDYLRDDVIPQLLEHVDGGPVRVWSAGCSAGQEPYSIAMLLHDIMGEQYRDRVKIYATDLDEEALDQARQATYTEKELRGVPENFRERYFEQVGSRWQLSADLRRTVIFGRNDVTLDAPISRIDILLCRNTLMYFNAEAQSRVVSRLGFALRDRGVLLLGKAEMLLNHTSTFEPIDLKRRFFRKIKTAPTDAAFSAPWRIYGRDGAGNHNGRLRSELIMSSPVAQIAVGPDRQLALVNHRAGAMLGLSERDLGRPFSDLDIAYTVSELGPGMAAALEGRDTVTLREVPWRERTGTTTYLDIEMVPLAEGRGSVLGLAITFTDVTRFHELQVEVETANRQLETAYEELQSTNEELETTNEELQSTVEELETTNEELQSTNEELETMNEELQSTNDELQLTNEQLRDRSSAVTQLNAFMQSIFNSLDGAVIVVDRDLVVQAWSRQAEELWGLRELETVGQPLLSLDSGLPGQALRPWLVSVIGGAERRIHGRHLEAVNRRGRTVDLRVSVTPMSTPEDDATGALVLFEEAPESTST
ncbi:CheR family methyltransferase [Knoellia sp. CPCC 206450]|uniref:CheR family methyltransferase n=1 Tax=Knoellia tibetensis TaxID=3404798 RepID=UPI003B427B81